MTPKYSIIITTKNEEFGIAKVLCSIPDRIEKESEVIVVDSSNDLTPVIAERLGAKVIREEKLGKGRAMKRGVKTSKGDILVFLDGDGTDPPQYIPKLGLKVEEVPIPLIKRAGGILKSKLVTSPRMQRKIFDVALRYVEEEKIRVNLKKFRAKFEKNHPSA